MIMPMLAEQQSLSFIISLPILDAIYERWLIYSNVKLKVHSPDWETDFFDIFAGVFQEDLLAPYF